MPPIPKNAIVVGTQWGDEGKGKVVDALAEFFDIVARYQGGANAGHTVVVGEKKFVLQLVPTGIVRANKIAVIGNGVVVNPEDLFHEIEVIEKAGISVGNRLKISDRAHLILPYHRSHEAAAEHTRTGGKLGTTAKGIGPSYEDKAARRGLRTCDLADGEGFRRKCGELLADKNRLASALYPAARPDENAIIDQYYENARRILPYLTDVSKYLNTEMDNGKRVLFEGAQGTLLDIDHGTYPYVTSSSAAAGGAMTGTGVGPTRVDTVIGVSKAYATRVGSGPFPTEAHGAEGEKLRERGGEYGAVTGRPRRCGWFDAPAARYSFRLNHLSTLVITKLDILDHLAEIPVGVGYEYRGKQFFEFPCEGETVEKMQPLYRMLPGWQKPTVGLKEHSQLPQNARDYLRYLSDMVGVEIGMISTGPERSQTIWLENGLLASLFTSG